MAPNNYIVLQDVKDHMPTNEVANTNSVWDTLVTNLCQRMSRDFDLFTNRKEGAYFVSADSTRYYNGPGYGLFSPIYGFRTQRLSSGYTGAISLPIDEIATAPTSVAMAQTAQIATVGGSGNYTAIPNTDYFMEPQNAADDGRPYTKITLDIVNGTTRVFLPYMRGIQVIGKFGYRTTTPDDVKEAVLLMAIRELRRNQPNYQDVAVILGNGQVLSGEKVDQTIDLTIRSYKRHAI